MMNKFSPKILTRDFYLRNAIDVAKDLLGKLLVHKTKDGIIAGMIVETEAYLGETDAAAHSYKRLNSKRTNIQYDVGGYAYIYLIYGLHYCFNVTANSANIPEAVLIRALEPIDGIDIMKKNRKNDKIINLCNGPGKLCAALAINNNHYGIDLCKDELYISDYREILQESIIATPRINIDYSGEAKDYLWRFYIKDNEYISR